MLRLIIVVISGIILIILSYKLKEKDVNINVVADQKKENKFNDYLDNEEISSKITRIDDNIGELKKRIDEIQQSLLLLGDDVQRHDEEQYDTEKKDSEKDKEKGSENKKAEENRSQENVKTNDEIFKMYDRGCSVEEICSILKIGKGEVLLRLGLRK